MTPTHPPQHDLSHTPTIWRPSMNESVVDVRWAPTCPTDCRCHALFRSGFHVASDLVDAWHTVAARPDVDVGDPGERHIAGARLGRAMFVRRGSLLGHRTPTS